LGKTTDFQKIQPQKGSAHPEPIITNSSKIEAAAKKTSSNLAVIPKDTGVENCPFRSLINEWLDACRADGRSAKTIQDYREKVFKFWWWWSEHSHYALTLGSHPKNVTTKEARAFAAYLREPLSFRWGERVPRERQELSAASIASYGRTVKVFFNWLEQEGHIEQTPFNRSVKFTNRHKQDRIIKNIEAEDLARIFAVLTTPERLNSYDGCRDLAMISFLLDSGIRRGELLSIRLCDIDLDKGRCAIRGKTGKRWALFSPTCLNPFTEYLGKYRNDQEQHPNSFLWLTEDGEPLSYDGFGSVIRRIEKKSGVDFHAHKLRHTFATMMGGQGVNVFDLKEMLGHASITTTQIYVQQDVTRLAEVHRTRSPLSTLAKDSNSGGLLPGLKRRRGRPRKERH
jgi:integrase/recombinase XerD